MGLLRSEDPEARMASWRLTIIDKIPSIDYKVSFIEQLSECTIVPYFMSQTMNLNFILFVFFTAGPDIKWDVLHALRF